MREIYLQRYSGYGLLLVFLLLTGCASVPKEAVVVEPGSAGRQYLPTEAARPGRLARYTARDGKQLGYVEYTDDGASTALVYLHGIESHGGWFAMAADRLRTSGYDVYLLDRRGSGLNRENRGFPSGHVDSYLTLFDDIQAFIGPLHKRYDKVVLVGLSWGGKLALAYGLTYPRDVDGLVLITPGLRSMVEPGVISKLLIGVSSVFNPQAPFKTPIEPEMFTTTPRYLDYIRGDPLRLHYASARFFMETRRLDGYIDRLMPNNRLPIQLYLAGKDRIIDNRAVKAVLAQGTKYPLDMVTYGDQTHSIQFDAPDRLVRDISRWVKTEVR